jgi:4-hydroxy-tetrahydrodipicolinate synthase
MQLTLRGAMTALVTPFTDDGAAVDWNAFEALVEAQIDGGIAALVPCGTTGEAPTLSDREQREVVERTVALASGRVPVIAGTGSNSTKKTIDASKVALEAGADAVMIVMPYYNKPSQDGMRRHIELVAQAVSAPIVLYNIPGRTGVELSVESLLVVLETCPNVVGVKDATGNVLRCQELSSLAGDRVHVLCGDDGLTVPMMSVGAVGVISVTSNVLPKQVAEVVEDALGGRFADAQRKHFALLPVHAAMFIEPSPAPVKAALALQGRARASVRPPLVEASEAARARVARALEEYRA